MAKKRALRKTAAAVKRHEKQRAKDRAKWVKREQRLVQLIETYKSNPSMQPQEWIDGQVEYTEKLLANHRAAKPK